LLHPSRADVNNRTSLSSIEYLGAYRFFEFRMGAYWSNWWKKRGNAY